MTVILDAGHYEGCPGKRSPVLPDGNQLFEWEFDLDLAHRIKSLLYEHDIKCIIIPQTESLTARANAINEICKKEKCIAISIHGNAAGAGESWMKATGWEVWSTKGKTNSDKLAQCFLAEFPKVFPDKKLRGHKEENFTVLQKSNCPCVLTENFFYDNEDECKEMLGYNMRNSIAELHVKAIINYITEYGK